MENHDVLQAVEDLTTRGSGLHPDAEALVDEFPTIAFPVKGHVWKGAIGGASALIRMPEPDLWNGKLMIGGTPAVRSEFAMDCLLSDIVLQKGYAYASCDKATPGLILRDPSRSMAEWTDSYQALTDFAKDFVSRHYGQPVSRTYIAGASNGGYVVRRMLEQFPGKYDGGVEWEGVLWSLKKPHILETLPVWVAEYPVYCNWRGDRTASERHEALSRMLLAGLHPESEPYWGTYFMMYWLVSLWLYGRNLDPDWEPFALDWSNDWLRDPSPIGDYPWQDRVDLVAKRIAPLENTGIVKKPLLSVAGNWDCLVPFRHHAQGYADLVRDAGCEANHRLYEIARGNHVDGLLRTERGLQQPVLPYFEAALQYLEDWVEKGIVPPGSGYYETLAQFAPEMALTSVR